MALDKNYFVLKNGAIIEITPAGEMLFKDQSGNIWGKATGNQKVIIEKLLASPGEFVPTYDLCSNRNVKKKLGSLIPTIMDNIESKYADGCRILLHSEDDIIPPVKTNPITRNTGVLTDLAGGYYCFYLDPNGHPLGAYVLIDSINHNDTTQMKAYAIFGIANDNDLIEAAKVFDHDRDYETYFRNPEAGLSCGDSACLWADGEVKKFASHLIAVSLKGSGETRWNIVIDASAYMLDTRPRIQDYDFYRGGMATVIAAWSPWGTTAFRFGMVRKSCFNPEIMSINSPVIINKLKPTYHVNLSSTVDNDFYTWLDDNRPKKHESD